jgi:putative phosphoribosyl transferase
VRSRLANRTEAGRQLGAAVADWLARHPGLPPPVVLALPLDLVMVRKLGVPGQPELAAGAVVEGDPPARVENPEVIAACGVSRAELDAAERRELAEIARRRAAWLAGRPPVAVEGRTVIVVDDGLATGATMRAALAGLRARRPAALVLAVPVAPADTLARLGAEADGVICLATPEPFRAIGVHYDDFAQLTDVEVTDTLARFAPPPA